MELRADNNRLAKLPASIVRLTRLRELHLTKQPTGSFA